MITWEILVSDWLIPLKLLSQMNQINTMSLLSFSMTNKHGSLKKLLSWFGLHEKNIHLFEC